MYVFANSNDATSEGNGHLWNEIKLKKSQANWIHHFIFWVIIYVQVHGNFPILLEIYHRWYNKHSKECGTWFTSVAIQKSIQQIIKMKRIMNSSKWFSSCSWIFYRNFTTLTKLVQMRDNDQNSTAIDIE